MSTNPISIVIPTRNRVHTLRLVCHSYCEQADVDQIIFVNDAGSAELAQFVSELAKQHEHIDFAVVDNEQCLGASASRNRGTDIARNEFILFCDDDEYLDADYARVCRDKLLLTGAGAVSGRRVYMREGETPRQALIRFGNGFRKKAPFSKLLCELTNAAHFEGDADVPFTNAIIVTRKSLIQTYRFDESYTYYREESDFQMNLFVHGLRIIMSNDCHSIHLPPSQIYVGPVPKKGLKYIYLSTRANQYFYKKYWSRYTERVGLKVPRSFALLAFTAFLTYRTYIRSYLVNSVRELLSIRARVLGSNLSSVDPR